MKRLIALVFILAFGALGAGAYLVYEAYVEVFPALPSGIYSGALHVEGREATSLFIDSSAGPRDLLVAVGDAAMPAQRARTFDDTGTAGLPLILTGPQTRLRLIGSEKAPDLFEGTFIDPIRNERGRWRIERVTVAALSPSRKQELQSWAYALQELQGVERGLAEGSRPAAAGNLSVDYADVPSSDPSDLQPLREELEHMARRAELSGRLLDAGRLVYLSRETISREGRWIEQMLKLEAPETNPSFQEDLARAYRVKDLLDQIAAERHALDRFAFQDGGEKEKEDDEPSEGSEGESQDSSGLPPVEQEGEFYDDL